jgi:hypothetical protein
MNKIRHWALLLTFVVLLVNCGASREQIVIHSITRDEGIFSEVNSPDGPPPGYADLVIKASLKTHLKGYTLLEPKDSPRGGPSYTFVINIDGQAKTYEAKGKEERGPRFDDQGKELPEGGLGMQYAFEQKLRLKPGPHRIFFGIPGEQYSKELNLTLQEGESYLLNFKPFYMRYPRGGRPAFELGLCGYNASLTKIQ